MKTFRYRKTIVVVLAALVALLWAIELYRNDVGLSLLEAMESRGSRVLGTRVDIADANVDRDSGEVSLAGLEVANPGGFSNREMLTVDAVAVHADFGARIIERIRLSGVNALLEFRGARSNFQTVGERIAASDKVEEAAAGDVARQADSEAASAGQADTAGADAPVRDDWVVADVEFVAIHVTVRADWTSEVVDFDAGGLSVSGLDAGTDDLVRAVAARFLHRVLASAAERVDDARLAEALREKARELRADFSASGKPAGD